MEYLVRKRKARVAHLWAGSDTACRMATTGGLKLSLYEVCKQPVRSSDGERLDVCRICEDLQEKAATNTKRSPEPEIQRQAIDLTRAILRPEADACRISGREHVARAGRRP